MYAQNVVISWDLQIMTFLLKAMPARIARRSTESDFVHLKPLGKGLE